MANIASQKKRILRSERERIENRQHTSQVKTYFRRLEEAVGPERQAFRFVLGLILMRKRLLRYDGSVRKTVGQVEQEWWRVTPRAAPGTGVPGSGGYEAQSLDLLNPQLDDQKTQEVTLQLGEVLEAQL